MGLQVLSSVILSLLVAMKAFFDSLSIDIDVVGAFLGCVEIVSKFNLPFFSMETQRKCAAIICG